MKTFYNIAEYLTGAVFNILFIVLTIIAVYFVGTRAYSYGKTIFADNSVSDVYEQYTVVIPEGEEPGKADAMEVANIIKSTGLIKNSLVFYIEARLNGTYNKFRSGTYIFDTDMGAGEIMDIIQRAQFAPAEDTKIVIPEGLNLRKIGDLCESKGLFTAEEFLAACAEYERNYYFLDMAPNRANILEGYLFPDTYLLPENPQPKDLIDRMLNRFQEIFDYEMEERTAELGLTLDQVIIMASIIEKEIRVAEERALCSSIIYNRLKISMSLQMCSTVLYVLDKQIDRLLYSDLEVDSPYNTYKYPGLPVGPICNPGKNAIIAALNPADTNYLYMVLSDELNGEHVFTHDPDVFQDAKTRYKQIY